MSGDVAVQVERDGPLALVRVGSGNRANALQTRDWLSLAEACAELAADDGLGAVIVTGSGTTSFSSGSEMSEWIGAQPAAVEQSFAAMESALTAVESLPVPVIAEVRGAALGAGCQLACACDLRMVGSHVKMGMPIARWGILVPPTFAARISLLTGPAVARDLLLTGRMVDGQEAVRIGLASYCTSEARLEQETRNLVGTILAHPPAAVRAAKRAVDALIAPERERLRSLPSGPAADYPSLQTGLTSFLPRAQPGPN